jgi:hypothetical protein
MPCLLSYRAENFCLDGYSSLLIFTAIPLTFLEPSCSQIEPSCSQIEPSCSQIEPSCSQIEPSCSQIKPSCSQIKPSCSQISILISRRGEELHTSRHHISPAPIMPVATSDFPPIDVPNVDIWNFLFENKERPFPDDKGMSWSAPIAALSNSSSHLH